MTDLAFGGASVAAPTRYGPVIRAAHWAMAAGFAFLWASGWWMRHGMEHDSPAQEALYDLHKSVGVTMIGLLAIRVAARTLSTLPPLPAALPERERRLAALGHLGLYTLTALALTTGWALTDFGGHGVVWFGVAMPQLFPTLETLWGLRLDPLASDLHAWLAYGVLGLAAVHVCAVFWHRRRHGVDLLRRMGLGGGA